MPPMTTTDWIIIVLSHTPLWVYGLFAFLMWRGLNAMTEAKVSPWRLALIPAAFVIWGASGLFQKNGFSALTVSAFFVAALAGAALGLALLWRTPVEIDRANGLINRPADYTVLPLILLAFGVKYTLAVMVAMTPALQAEPMVMASGMAASGLFAGIFIGKLTVYWTRYYGAPAVTQSIASV
jgi:hypothetical protein